MPEGDTIYRTAARLRPILAGQTIEHARSRDPALNVAQLVGRKLSGVEARGKHLLFHLDDGGALHSHMGMTGSWHLYRPGERWQKPEHRAAIVLEVPGHVVVCFSPEVLELLTAATLRRHEHLQTLGPDVLSGTLDSAEVLRRFRASDALPLGEAVMNQRIVCGIGNIYKSETLFLAKANPFATVGEFSDERMIEIVERAQALMSANLDGASRRTRPALSGPRMWVYGRSGEPCFNCGTTIELRRQGDLGRTTYWCPQCQGHPEVRGSA
ncbi:MAG TPA: DNA-formamidopyrimidine glycosylase family protein [Pirellulales bacterium]|jgi:endonuclease-8|nr:DNA-formamidopyrimidine glycosylase family protein [Pirellulales bacterium]